MWSGLNSLRIIDFSGNNVTGYVPPQIMQVGGLQNLSLANNGFQGNLPSQLGSNMTSISYRDNQLTGEQHRPYLAPGVKVIAELSSLMALGRWHPQRVGRPDKPTQRGCQ